MALIAKSKSKLIRDSAIRVKNNNKNTESSWFKNAINHLTRKSEDQYTNNKICIARYYDDQYCYPEVFFPRFYKFDKVMDIDVKIDKPQLIDIECKAEVKNERQQVALNYMCSNDNGILCLQPGEGKTVITIMAICKTKYKSIIFCHKDSLVDQWIERFKEFTNIDDKDIGKLKSSTYEADLDKSVVVATVQSYCNLIKKVDNFHQIVKSKKFGFAVWDECHTSTGAEMFSLSSLYTTATKTFGLSATPKRLDGNSDIINFHLGEVYIPDVGTADRMTPRVIFIYKDLKAYTTKNCNYINRLTGFDKKNGCKPGFDKMRYFGYVEKSDVYKAIVKKIMTDAEEGNRNVLFLASKIKTLDIAAKFIKDKTKVGFFIPRSQKERDNELKKQFVFSTFGSARDGTDKVELDLLVLSDPTSNVEQAVGRVTRVNTKASKLKPVVIHIIDTGCDDIAGRSSTAERYYDSVGWTIERRYI